MSKQMPATQMLKLETQGKLGNAWISNTVRPPDILFQLQLLTVRHTGYIQELSHKEGLEEEGLGEEEASV